MKITLFIGGLGSGGAEHVITELANYLSAHHTVTILTWSSSNTHYMLSKKVKLISCRSEVKKNLVVRNIESYRNLKKYIKEENTECFVAFLVSTVYFLLSLKKYISSPVIFSVRNYPKEEYGGVVKGFLSHVLLKRADGVVFQTDDQRQCMKYLSKMTYATIPNAVNVPLECIKTKEEIDNVSSKTIMAVGRLSKQKNYRMMILVMSKILKEYPDYQLYIYGEGPEEDRLRKLIVKCHMQEQIHLAGITKQITEKLRKTELFIMTSDYEGISNALIEAMTVGVTVVATDCRGGGARLLIQNGKNGLLIPRRDRQAFEKAVRRVLDDKNLRISLARNAQNIRKDFSKDVIYRKWESFIESVVRLR